MATYNQDLIFTVLPNGQTTQTVNGTTGTYLKFSVAVSPRLSSDSSATTQLSSYPDWSAGAHTWPDTLTALVSSISLQLRIPSLHELPAVQTGDFLPDAQLFSTVLGATTPVTPYVYAGLENRKIRSAPVGDVVDHLGDLYGMFGATSPAEFPTYEALVPAAAFGALGFEQFYNPTLGGPHDPGILGIGPERKQILLDALETALAENHAIPYDLSAIANSLDPSVPGAKVSLAFLQHEQFLRRPIPNVTLERPEPPVFDFHQIVGAASSLPTVLRVLGLVLDFYAGPIGSLDGTGTAQLALDASGLHPGTSVVLPAVQCQVSSDGVFRAVPSAQADTTSRMLKIGDTSRYRIVRVDHDGAIVKTMQFADNVTRSREQGAKRTLTTPGRFALPALKSGGFAIARSGRAVQMAAILQRQTEVLQDGFFGTGSPPVLHEEDITRGYRFDVFDQQDRVWRSLMWRQGTITVDGAEPITVTEEDTVVPAPTTASTDPSDPGDLYLQETLTRWDGWSLAVPRPGTAFVDGGPAPTRPGSSGYHVTTDWQVPGSTASGAKETKAANPQRLPRLRFGDSYQLRARAVDLAGNSLDVAEANGVTDANTVTAPVRHVRFEPLAAPRALLVAARKRPPVLLPGDSEQVVVVRSENASNSGSGPLDNPSAARLLIPAPTSVFLAEQHKAFDTKDTGRPMDQSAELWGDLAGRAASDIREQGALYYPSELHGTGNPYHFPPFLPINYLPDYASHAALVRFLPPNQAKASVAALPYDVAGQGWPKLQAVRVVLARGAGPDWSVRQVTDPDDAGNVTAELDVVLGKGDMVTTLVNSKIDADTAGIMALAEIIETWCAEHGVDPTPAQKAILHGAHWMVTPWRALTFVHAVRTPLKRPRLFLKPQRTVLGQTNAVFNGLQVFGNGSVLMSRKSTARVDVDATWLMPVDDGTSADPVTPRQFSGHAFTIEFTRDGKGVDPTATGTRVNPIADAANFAAEHEFNDTRYRAVNYRGTATSFYVEYFRQVFDLSLPSGNPVTNLTAAPVVPGVPFEASTVRLTLRWTDTDGTARSRTLVPAPAGTAQTAPSPTPGDYIVIEDPNLATDPQHAVNGTVQMLKNAKITVPDTADVEFSYVGPTIHTYSDPVADHTTSKYMIVPNTKRPDAPSVRYVVPIYSRSAAPNKVTRKGGALRVYLDRPWWSSGGAERLGVLCWHMTNSSDVLPPSTTAPYVTVWGFDPVYKSSTSLPGQPTPACFPLMTAGNSSGILTIDESSDVVDVAGHDVGFDASRGLWYCDIRITGPDGKELKSYLPFIRLALARYQPHSIPNAHLSKVVVVDYAQLAPNRSVTMTGSGTAPRAVTVTGRAAVGTAHNPTTPSVMQVSVEARDTRIDDDALAWVPVAGQPVVKLATSVNNGDEVIWSGSVPLPSGAANRQLRLTFEEYERVSGGTQLGRLVFTESIPLDPSM
jgi:hypothetical protein